MRASIEAIGGRRFILTLLIGAAGTVLQWHGKMDAAGTQYVALMIATVATYIAGNTWQKNITTRTTTEKEQ